MRVTVDSDKCQGHNRCYALAPDVFWATEALIRLVQREAGALARGGAAAGASHLDDGGPVVIPEGGTF